MNDSAVATSHMLHGLAAISIAIDVLIVLSVVTSWKQKSSLGQKDEKVDEVRLKRKTAEKDFRNRLAYLILFVLAQIVGLMSAEWPGDWRAIVAVLPFLIVSYHAVNLWTDAPSATTSDRDENIVAARVGIRVNTYYGHIAIFSRYIFPAALITVVGAASFMFDALRLDAGGGAAEFLPAPLKAALQTGAFEYGLIGAYLFVFIELGRRSVRNDVTPTLVIGCLVTLVVGPAFAASLPTIFGGGGAQGDLWNQRAIWIFAGYAPRFVFQSLAQAVRHSLQSDTRSIEDDNNRIPLNRIQGIGADEAARLAEEGITDVHGLACVDPLRLMRDTRFDNWRIVSWVDQALLVSVVKEELCEELKVHGCWGATDLAPFLESVRHQHPRRLEKKSPPAEGDKKEHPNAGTKQEGATPTESGDETEIGEIEAKVNVKHVRDVLARLRDEVRVQELAVLIRLVHEQPALGGAKGTAFDHGGPSRPVDPVPGAAE